MRPRNCLFVCIETIPSIEIGISLYPSFVQTSSDVETTLRVGFHLVRFVLTATAWVIQLSTIERESGASEKSSWRKFLSF